MLLHLSTIYKLILFYYLLSNFPSQLPQTYECQRNICIYWIFAMECLLILTAWFRKIIYHSAISKNSSSSFLTNFPACTLHFFKQIYFSDRRITKTLFRFTHRHSSDQVFKISLLTDHRLNLQEKIATKFYFRKFPSNFSFYNQEDTRFIISKWNISLQFFKFVVNKIKYFYTDFTYLNYFLLLIYKLIFAFNLLLLILICNHQKIFHYTSFIF